jgi:hypothetical protein
MPHGEQECALSLLEEVDTLDRILCHVSPGQGHEVVNVSRAQREPYQADSAWRLVEQVTADRTAEDAAGIFGQRILELKPDVVVDLICFVSSGRLLCL